MTDLILQALVGVGLLGAGVWWCYRRWIAARAGRLDWQGQGLLLLVSLTIMGGFIGGPFWWFGEPRAFAWALPPLAGRMLAAAGWSFAVVGFLVMERPTQRSLRLIPLLLATYLAPLVGAILFFHLDRFDFTAALTYAFFLIAVGMSVAAGWYWIRFPAGFAEPPSERATLPNGIARGWLIGVLLVTGTWGIALFVVDAGPSSLIWVWPGDLLTSRLIGAMLLTIAAGSAYALRYAETVRPVFGMLLTYGLGLCVASVWNVLAAKPVPSSYAIVFAAIALGSAALLLTERNTNPQ